MKAIIKTRLLLWLIGCFSLGSPALAQQKKQPSPVIPGRDDQRPLGLRYPAANKLQDFRGNRDYQYQTNPRPPDNPLLKFWYWLQKKIAEFLRGKAYQNFWQYVILAAIVAYAVYLLIKAEVLGFLFPAGARQSALPYEQVNENIHEINFDEAIDDAVNQRNYRLAVRLLYLQTLKVLTDRGQIHWQPDKTNRQYVYELQAAPLQAGFESLTTAFEYVWYGDFAVDAGQFGRLQTEFTQFTEQLYQGR